MRLVAKRKGELDLLPQVKKRQLCPQLKEKEGSDKGKNLLIRGKGRKKKSLSRLAQVIRSGVHHVRSRPPVLEKKKGKERKGERVDIREGSCALVIGKENTWAEFSQIKGILARRSRERKEVGGTFRGGAKGAGQTSLGGQRTLNSTRGKGRKFPAIRGRRYGNADKKGKRKTQCFPKTKKGKKRNVQSPIPKVFGSRGKENTHTLVTLPFEKEGEEGK